MPLLAVIVIGYTPPEPAAAFPASSPAEAAVNVAFAFDLKLGASRTVRVKVCWTVAPTPLSALMVIGYTPPEPTAGVPESSHSKGVGSVTVTPAGRLPVTENVGAGKPVAASAKLPAVPTVKVVLAPDVITGAWPTNTLTC